MHRRWPNPARPSEGTTMRGAHLARQARRPRRRPCPTRRSRNRPTSIVAHHLDRRSAAPTCTSTRCSGRSSTRATSSATSRWASSRRSGRRSPSSGRRPRGGPVQRLLRHLLHVRPGAALASARRPRCASRARAPRSSATPSSTARSRAARPSTCACRSATRCRSRCRTGRRTTGSSTSPTCCPPRGRRCEYAAVPAGRLPGRARPRPDRRHGHAHRPAPRRRDGHRRRPRARAAGAGAARRRRGARPAPSTARTSATSSAG